jgi:glycosyltransferase involved in cell wall biosynthesis
VKPLVSIVMPAYNAQEYIADALRSAIAQTWSRKEIIVVDDGSRDRTLDVVRQFQSNCLKVVTQENQGAAAARNKALSLSQGDYIQYLDADDLLAPDKLTRQIETALDSATRRTLLSCGWGKFFCRYYQTRFTPTPLWLDLTPVEWLIRKMALGVYLIPGCWLVSRELTQAAGPWDTSLLYDDDGEYFCRVLLASDNVQFVPEAKVYYRRSGSGSLGYIGSSASKREGLWCSMQRHINYLRSLEDSARTRAACVCHLQRYMIEFYPDRFDIVRQADDMARRLGGQLAPPLSWKSAVIAAGSARERSHYDRDHIRKMTAQCAYFVIKTTFGWRIAKAARVFLPRLMWSAVRLWDKALFRIQKKKRKAFWNGFLEQDSGLNHEGYSDVSTQNAV